MAVVYHTLSPNGIPSNKLIRESNLYVQKQQHVIVYRLSYAMYIIPDIWTSCDLS